MATIYCDECMKPATVNVQKLWVKWPIISKGKFEREPKVLETEVEEGENLFFCSAHYKRWIGDE